MMDVPVVAAAGFERYIHYASADVGQIAPATEKCAVGVWFSLGPLAAERISLGIEPGGKFIHQRLAVAHINGSLFVGCELRSNTFQTAQCSYGDNLAIGGRELVTGEDVPKEM